MKLVLSILVVGFLCQLRGTTAQCSPACQHGGTCYGNAYSSYYCSCTSGYTGTYCQTSYCSPSCQNGGTCYYNAYSSYYCSCTSGYTGTYCQTSISSSVCSPNPCLNGGTCSTTSGCTCSTGYTGTHCASSICSSSGTELTTRGMINSPNYPSYYSNNANCHWLLTASYDVITLSFHAFSTDSADYVRIYDGSSTSDNLLATLSGSSYSYATYTSKGLNMYVTFTSDSTSSYYTGFNATFSGSPPSSHESSSVAMAVLAAIVPLWLAM